MPSAVPDPWFPYACPNPAARLRLICLPFAGGGAAVFRPWARALPADIDVFAAQLPGRETRFREPPFTRMDPLVEALATAVRPYLDRPYAVFGHSLGALVSFELARELHRRGERPPAALIVAGHAAPHLPPPFAPLHVLPEPDFRAELRRLNGTPAAVLDNDELMNAFLPTLRADFTVAETYDCPTEPPLTCPVLALGAEQDPRTTYQWLEAWQALTRGPFQVQVVPGDHFFVVSQRAAVLDAIVGFLQSTQLAPPLPAGQMEREWQAVTEIPPLAPQAVHVWRAQLDRNDDHMKALERTLSADERERAARFHFQIDRQRYVVGRGTLRVLLGKYLGCEPADLRLWYNSHGKPAAVGQAGPGAVKFNASHSDSLMLVAVTRNAEVGVDVERVRAIADWRGLAARYFSKREVADLDAVSAAERERAFFLCWTRKEAYVKAHGLGMSMPLDRFSVSLTPGAPARLLAAGDDPAQVDRWELRNLEPAPGFAGALAVEGRGHDLWCGNCPW